MPRLSRSHCTSAPVIAMAPSRQYTAGSSPSFQPDGGEQPDFEWTSSVPVFSSMKQPVPYVFLASPTS